MAWGGASRGAATIGSPFTILLCQRIMIKRVLPMDRNKRRYYIAYGIQVGALFFPWLLGLLLQMLGLCTECQGDLLWPFWGSWFAFFGGFFIASSSACLTFWRTWQLSLSELTEKAAVTEENHKFTRSNQLTLEDVIRPSPARWGKHPGYPRLAR